MKFIAVQTGARHNYAVPSILSEAGMLSGFYTDACADVGLTKLTRCLPECLQTKDIQNLQNRQLPSHVIKKTATFEAPLLNFLLKKKLTDSNVLRQRNLIFEFEARFGKAMVKEGFRQATHVIAMYGEDGSVFLEKAKEKGLKTVTDINIHPDVFEILKQEQANYPGIEPDIPEEFIETYRRRIAKVAEVTDIFLAPSTFVQEGLMNHNIPQERYRLVPYAVDDQWFKVNNQPQPGRVLFAGTASLRKGIHIVGKAASLLRDACEFRIAGGVTSAVKQHPISKDLIFLGRVPRSEIKEEFRFADVFVLPSIAEGSAGVIYEALAAGIPVVTTHSAGSVVRDGIEGFVVSERDATALSERVEELVKNRELRYKMGIAAQNRARQYTWGKYVERFLAAIQS